MSQVREIVEQLEAIRGYAKLHPSGAQGQILGQETWRITLSGESLQVITDAAGKLIELEQQRDKLLAALELIMERMELPPDTDCYCHISPPCHDCVENSGIREAIELAESTLAEVRGGE